MTREAFIKKWLGNRDYNYCEENKELMREDLDSVLNFHKQQVNSVDSADVGETLPLTENDIKHLRTTITNTDVLDKGVPDRVAFKTGWNAALDRVIGKE